MKQHIFIRTIGLIILCLCYILLSFIFGNWVPYKGIRPIDCVPSKWVSKDPYIWFEVLPYEDNAERPQELLRGQIVLEDHTIEIEVLFYGGGGRIRVSEANRSDPTFFKGKCKFSPEKLVVRITKKGEFAPENDIIIFERTDIE